MHRADIMRLKATVVHFAGWSGQQGERRSEDGHGLTWGKGGQLRIQPGWGPLCLTSAVLLSHGEGSFQNTMFHALLPRRAPPYWPHLCAPVSLQWGLRNCSSSSWSRTMGLSGLPVLVLLPGPQCQRARRRQTPGLMTMDSGRMTDLLGPREVLQAWQPHGVIALLSINIRMNYMNLMGGFIDKKMIKYKKKPLIISMFMQFSLILWILASLSYFLKALY